MRKLLIIATFLFVSITSYGQLKPPQQTDTLTIKSVNYNYSEILEENWPCKHILKSTTHFQFGDQMFKIKKVEQLTWSEGQIQFVLSDDNGTTSRLTYEEQDDGTINISFSGYEFKCVLSRNKPRIAQQKGHATPSIEDFPAGHKSSDKADVYGRPNARMAGRTIIGAPPHPSYNIKQSGKVVVKIKVNRDGRVVEAQPGEAGTTLTDKQAWEAAKKAALKIQFNLKSDAPEYEYGTITYIFNIA